jgi:hypothetical protein
MGESPKGSLIAREDIDGFGAFPKADLYPA